MKISVGIFAYNEERNISATLKSLSEQTVFGDPKHALTIHVLPNGCRDRTAEVAGEALSVFKSLPVPPAACVNEIATPGKANAWNVFVHELSEPDADALLFLDADIAFGQPECLARVVAALENSPAALAAVDLPLKDIAAKKSPGVIEKLSLAASKIQTSGAPKIAGSLYLARAGAVRKAMLPTGIIVEDGFVKAMLLTEGFTRDEITNGIVRAADATHYFEALTGLSSWFKHERRLLLGTAVNILLFGHLRDAVARGESAAELVRANNAANPKWAAELAAAYRGPLPGAVEFMSAPFRQIRSMPLLKRLVLLPVAALRAILNTAVATSAQRMIRAGELRW